MILIVDNYELLISAYKILFINSKHDFEYVDNVNSAIKFVKANPDKISHIIFDLLIYEEKTGFEMIHELSDIIKLKNIELIAQTGAHEIGYQKLAEEMKIKHFFFKPFPLEQLVKLIDRAN